MRDHKDEAKMTKEKWSQRQQRNSLWRKSGVGVMKNDVNNGMLSKMNEIGRSANRVVQSSKKILKSSPSFEASLFDSMIK